jgi:hypothetical protein
MFNLKSNLSKVLVVCFVISSNFCLNLMHGAQQPLASEHKTIILIKNKFQESKEISVEAYELFSPDGGKSVTISKKKDSTESPDKQYPFFLVQTPTGLVPNFYYCFPTEGMACPKGLFYFSEGPTDALMDAFITGKNHIPLRSSPEDECVFTFDKNEFKKVIIGAKKNLAYEYKYNESTAKALHPFSFLTDKGEIDLNEPLKKTKDPLPQPTKDPFIQPAKDPLPQPAKDPFIQPAKDPLPQPSKEHLALQQKLLMLKKELVKLKQKLAMLNQNLRYLEARLGKA